MNFISTFDLKILQRKTFYLLLLTVFGFIGCKTTKNIAPEVSTTGIETDIRYLASDELEGRETGTEGERLAAAYIARRMEAIGLTYGNPEKKSYYQDFDRVMRANPHSLEPSEGDKTISVRNVIGYMDNGAANTVVIGAHYDHLGYGSEGSLHAGEKAIHNGADDNASGVSAMLSIAESLVGKKMNQNFLFIAFSGEEKGLWGSNYYVKNPTYDLSTFNYMINMDMVGRLNAERQLAVHGTGTSPVWTSILDGIKSPEFKFARKESGIGPSDHTSFYLEDIPVLFCFTGQHQDYHRPSDDIELVNFEGIADISSFILQVIEATDDMGKLTFTKTKDEREEVPDFKVTLGVIPDYLFDGKGMRIDGVREGRPAHNADMMKGDIVKTMGDIEIVDMMSYMRALGSFEAGQTVIVTVERDGELLEKRVTF